MGYSQEEWTPLLTHEKMAGHRDAQSHALCKSNQNNCKQNSPRIVVSWTVPTILDHPWSVLVGGGGVKTLPFCLGTSYNVSSMEDTEISWLLCWQWKHTAQNIIYRYFKNLSFSTSANPCFPLRRAYLFTFIAESSSSYKKHQLESTTVICMHCY